MGRFWMVRATLLLASVAAGCGGGAALDANGVRAAAEGAQVRVENHYTLAVEVLSQGPGGTVRLGVVSPGMTSTFALGVSAIRNGVVEILLRRAGDSETISSGPMDLQPGQVVDYVVGTNFSNSSAAVH